MEKIKIKNSFAIGLDVKTADFKLWKILRTL